MKIRKPVDEQPYTSGESIPRSPYEASDEEKKQYHFHKLSSVSLYQHSLICTFAIDEDPSSIFYTPQENGKEPVRKIKIETSTENIEITKDRLAVRVGEQLISAEEIWGD